MLGSSTLLGFYLQTVEIISNWSNLGSGRGAEIEQSKCGQDNSVFAIPASDPTSAPASGIKTADEKDFSSCRYGEERGY